jgi:hypothetical protein
MLRICAPQRELCFAAVVNDGVDRIEEINRFLADFRCFLGFIAGEQEGGDVN